MTASATAPLAALRGVTVGYAGRPVVHDVDLEVRPGEVVGLIGRNGAGKTTILRALLGLVPVSAGSVHLDPTARVGVAFDTVSFPRSWSARTALRSLSRYLGLDPRGGAVEAALESVGFPRAARDRRLGQCSHGMQQKVSMAAALLGDPTLLVLDEPHNGLDPIAVDELASVLRRQARLGRAVLVSSHLVGELDRLCDRVVLVGDGTVVLTEAVSRLTASTSVLVRADPPAGLQTVLAAHGYAHRPDPERPDATVVDVPRVEAVPELAHRLVAAGLSLRELRPVRHSLTDVITAILGGHSRSTTGPVPGDDHEAPDGRPLADHHDVLAGAR